MKKFIGIITGAAILALMIWASVMIVNTPEPTSVSSDDPFDYDNIMALIDNTDYSSVNPDSIIATSEITGNLPEKIIGDPNAKVLIYEYADYACSHCAEMNTVTKKLLDKYD